MLPSLQQHINRRVDSQDSANTILLRESGDTAWLSIQIVLAFSLTESAEMREEASP